jgi:cyclase
MRRSRVIPCLLLSDGGLVKTVRFRKRTYVGDPINAVRIFNEKEVDELVLLDIDASRRGSPPDEALIEDVASEAFMPIAYGGGVRTAQQAIRLAKLGVEKVIIDSAAIARPALVGEVAASLGSSSTLVSITVSRDWRGRWRVYDASRRQRLAIDPSTYARKMAELGAGELLIHDADRDGTYEGFDGALVSTVAAAVPVPLIACGGAGTVDHLAAGVAAGAGAVAAGSQFIFFGPHRAVLINFPKEAELAAVMP